MVPCIVTGKVRYTQDQLWSYTKPLVSLASDAMQMIKKGNLYTSHRVSVNAGTRLAMALPLPIPPLRLFEIDDQSWFPAPLRECVQAVLSLMWRLQLPIIQPASPASLVAHTLQSVIGERKFKKYTFIDFCAGAGGPTPYIEQEVNSTFEQARQDRKQLNGQLGQNGHAISDGEDGNTGVDFILTDIHPHLPSWSAASKRSENLRFVPSSVDAANAPKNILELAGMPQYGNTISKEKNKKIFRLFSLAFHHFDDPLATKILKNTFETSEGFAIFELQARDVDNIFTVLMMWPLLLAGSWYWFWGQWEHLFWTYVVPVVPFVIVFDGLVSCLRTRRDGEVTELIKLTGKSVDGWRFEKGSLMHTWPTGSMGYFIGIKEGLER